MKITTTSRKWFVMIAVASGVFLGTIDGSIVNIALPILEKQLNTQFSVVQWVVLSYLLTVATLMLVVGRLADIFGKKPLYLTGFAVFTLGSFLCGLANSVTLLIAFRVLQAVGAAMITALGSAIVTEAFPLKERGLALGISGSMVSIGLISGPTLGGLILGALSWHWIFFVNLPVGLIGILLVIRFVPATAPGKRERFDLPGALSMFACLLSFLLALTLGQERGFSDFFVLGLLAASIGFLGLFIRIETHTHQPMIQFGMFQDVLFSVNLLTGFITFVSTAGMVLLMPFYLQNVLGYSPQNAGLLLSVFPLSMGIVAPLAGSLSDRFGTRRLAAVGLAVLLGGYLGVSTLSESTTAWGYVLRFLPVGLGMGLFQSPNNSAIMGAAPRNRLGLASSLLSLSRTIGQTTGLAVFGAVWANTVQALWGTGASGDTTAAPAAIQTAALHSTFLIVSACIGLGLALSLWALWKEKQVAGETPTRVPGEPGNLR